MKPEKSNKDESITWVVVVSLVIVFFIFQWNLIFSIASRSCWSFNDYWLNGNHNGMTVFELTFWAFFLIGCLALIELLRAMQGSVTDSSFSIYVNGAVLLAVASCLFVLSRQEEYMSIEWEKVEYGEIFPVPHLNSDKSFQLYREFNEQRYCNGETEHRFCQSLEECDQWRRKFNSSGLVRTGLE